MFVKGLHPKGFVLIFVTHPLSISSNTREGESIVWLQSHQEAMGKNRGVKRLRGAALEQAMIEKPAAPTVFEVEHSALATRLLLLWSQGTLSAIAIREIAHLAILDGAVHTDLALIANTGTCGSNPGNCHRDILKAFCQSLSIGEAHSVQVPAVDPKSSKQEMVDAGVFLPHISFSELAQMDQFDEFFQTGSVPCFWGAVESAEDPKFAAHPLSSEPGFKEKVIPMFIHGDKVEFQDRDSIMVWSVGSLLSSLCSMDSSLLLSAFPSSCTVEDSDLVSRDGTWSAIFKWLVWSLLALLVGVHPLKDPDNNDFPPDSKFAKLAGKPLHPAGWRACIWVVEGDQEFFSNTLHLPHWSNESMCHECHATKSNPMTTWKNIAWSVTVDF